MKRIVLAVAAQLMLLPAVPAHAQVLKSATALSPGSLMLSVAPTYVFHRNRPLLTGMVMAQACVGLIKDWDLVFQAGVGLNLPPFVGGRVEAPLAQDQPGQPGVAFGLGAHWGYPSGFPGAHVSSPDQPMPGMLSIDAVLIVSEGFGNFVIHGAAGYQFVIDTVNDKPLGLGLVSVGAQYLITPHLSVMAEAGFNAAVVDDMARYLTVAFVFYAL